MPAITVTQALLDVLRSRHVSQKRGGGQRWQLGQVLQVQEDVELEPYHHLFGGFELPARMGAFSYSVSALVASTRVGRYCSIGGLVEFIMTEHPVEWVTTSPFSYFPWGPEGMSDYLVGEKTQTSFKLHPHEEAGKA